MTQTPLQTAIAMFQQKKYDAIASKDNSEDRGWISICETFAAHMDAIISDLQSLLPKEKEFMEEVFGAGLMSVISADKITETHIVRKVNTDFATYYQQFENNTKPTDHAS